MPHAIRFHQTGGPEVLQWEPLPVGAPGPGQVRLRQTAVGLNFIDTYHRSGLYPVPLPATPGMEGAGVVAELGPGVAGFEVGQRVAYAGGPLGAYAEERLIPSDRLVPLPDDVSDEGAAAMMLQGMTAQYLLRRTFPVKRGDTLLVHAAAGGVGLILCQWAAALGATVIGTVSTDEKAALARENGCAHPVVYTREDFVAAVRELTGGRGVDVVYDSVGRDTFLRSLECLRPLGTMVSFGQSSGAIPPLDVGLLSQRGSLFLTRPTLMTYTARREDLLAIADELFSVVRAGTVRIPVRQRWPLRDAAEAHRALE
ncbi:MAG: quinone oxidoreductase family protein, partial [Myxococcales bacterium]